MADLINLDILLEHVDRAELEQVAGSGSHNLPEGRSLDSVKIAAAITYASDMANGYIRRRFPRIVELTPETVPPLIQGYVCDITRYRLRSRTGNRNTTSDEVEQRFKEATNWLKDVSRGMVNVDFADTSISGGGTTNQMGRVHAEIPAARAPGILDGYRDA